MPTAKWLSETRAKARNPQNTKAWAMPGAGRCSMTLAWQRTSQKKSQMRRPSGCREKSASFFERRMVRRIGPKRKKKRPAEAKMHTARRMISSVEKWAGSEKVVGR